MAFVKIQLHFYVAQVDMLRGGCIDDHKGISLTQELSKFKTINELSRTHISILYFPGGRYLFDCFY